MGGESGLSKYSKAWRDISRDGMGCGTGISIVDFLLSVVNFSFFVYLFLLIHSTVGGTTGKYDGRTWITGQRQISIRSAFQH